MNNKFLYCIIGIVIGAVGFWLLLPSSPMQNTITGSKMMSTQTSDMLDAHFIEQMIPHHQDAITMSKIAQTKTQRPELKKLADNIILSQEKEITQMKDWYKKWFGKELPTGDEVMQHHGMMSSNSSMHMGRMGTEEDLNNLTNASDFDTEFVKEMIPHHQMAVMMASMLRDGTKRPEMKKLADNIITAQTIEIKQMRTWLTQWGN